MSLAGKLEFCGLTNVGKRRSHNEDRIASDLDAGIVVLADGMGGYRAGEVASAIAVDEVMQAVRQGLEECKARGVDEETGYSAESLVVKSAIEKANATIYQTAQTQPQCRGMGTTVVAAAFYNDRVTIAHVGDSRLYRLRDGVLVQVTSDHSLLQELIDQGFYTQQETKLSMNKNLVTRALGIEAHTSPDVQEAVVKPGDVYLLCSDGLTDLVDDDDIRMTIEKHSASLDDTAKCLVDKANENGGKDNISVILARSLMSSRASKSWYSKVLDWF